MFKKKDTKTQSESLPVPNQRGRGKLTIVIRMPYRNPQSFAVHCYFSGHSPSSVIDLIKGLLPTNATPTPIGNELCLEVDPTSEGYTNSAGFVSDLIDGMHDTGFVFISKSYSNTFSEFIFRCSSPT
jgi:hypothetical protein